MRQRLGKKKHELCEQIGGKKYQACLVRGNTEHFLAICVIDEWNADKVNYKTGMCKPYTINGVTTSAAS